ncbi:MAG: hypothetical protein K1X94_23790 [Sandaracinaceae bacterium]|jgi:hypothetical protein|nr:hypothetical protein [Sandaracinaceae bacterium]
MTVRKLSVAIDPQTAEQAAASARRVGASLSGWITEAMQDRLRREAGLAAVAEWEAESGALTPREIANAERRMTAAFARAARAAERNERRTRKRAS